MTRIDYVKYNDDWDAFVLKFDYDNGENRKLFNVTEKLDLEVAKHADFVMTALSRGEEIDKEEYDAVEKYVTKKQGREDLSASLDQLWIREMTTEKELNDLADKLESK